MVASLLTILFKIGVDLPKGSSQHWAEGVGETEVICRFWRSGSGWLETTVDFAGL
jgi:hypothetical protein